MRLEKPKLQPHLHTSHVKEIDAVLPAAKLN
jgi:hypothetical protein